MGLWANSSLYLPATRGYIISTPTNPHDPEKQLNQAKEQDPRARTFRCFSYSDVAYISVMAINV